MRTARSLVTLVLLAAAAAAAGGAVKELPYPDPKPAFDHTKIDRTLAEPAYASTKPAYRFYAFGPAGKTVIAMVADESKGTGAGYDTLYVDLDHNGDLTGAGEKFAAAPGSKKAGPYRPKKDRKDLLIVPVSGWGKEVVAERKLDVADPKLDYRLTVGSAFTLLEVNAKKGDWGFPMRVMDARAPWGTVKAKAPVIRVGGPDWVFANDRFIQRRIGRKTIYPCRDKGAPAAKPGDKVWVDATSPFFAGSSPCIRFHQGAVYSPWTARGFSARIEDPKGSVISHLEFHQSCGGARWATTLVTSEYPDGKAVMVFDMDSGGYQGRIVQRIPFKVDNPDYGKPLPELAVTKGLRRANPGATVMEIYQGAKLADLGVPVYDGARDVYFGMYGLGSAHAQSCQNLGSSISFGHDVRNELHLGGEGRRALLKFDLSMLDASVKVRQAVLALEVMEVNPKVDCRTRAFAMKKRWSEILVRDGGGLYRGHGTPPRRYHGSWPVGDPEPWEKRMFSGDGDRHAEPIAEVTFAKPGWVSLDVTRAVRKWVSGEWANHGLGLALVAGRREYGGKDVVLRSSDFPADPRPRPCLVLVLDGKPKPRPHEVKTANDGLVEAAAAARTADRPLLVCALSAESLTSRAFETRTLARKKLGVWLDKHFVVARIDAADPRHKRFLLAHGVRRFPSMVVMSPDPAQPDNYALIEPLDWDAPSGIFRSSFEFEQLVARNLGNALDRAKQRNGRYGAPRSCGRSGR